MRRLTEKERNRLYRHISKEKKLFAWIMKKFNMSTDQELADFLYTSPSVISQVRNDKIGFSPKLIAGEIIRAYINQNKASANEK